DRLKRAYKVGVNMAFGTDVDVQLPGETRGTLTIDYITSWQEAGVPAADTLRAMTVNAARLLGVDKERGFLRPGFHADIIATPDNPAHTPHPPRKAPFVIKAGLIVKQWPPAFCLGGPAFRGGPPLRVSRQLVRQWSIPLGCRTLCVFCKGCGF